MRTVIVTGAGGLVGAATVRHFATQAEHVIGIDNDMRSYFFGSEASTTWSIQKLTAELPSYEHREADVRDRSEISRIFTAAGSGIDLVVHAAAQPSHDWAAAEPLTDFDVNAGGTLNVLEATRLHAPDAPFIFLSTNKVYGDSPNFLPLAELETRWELEPDHEWSEFGIPESMSIDHSTHSIFGASKVAADVMVQEYGRYFGIPTATFRCGCLTGPDHSGAQLHGFLAYLMKCTVTGTPYTIFGYEGKQVRDNIHVDDLVLAFDAFAKRPKAGRVYNMGGARAANCSMLEAISISEQVAGRTLNWSYSEQNRTGDHVWWISDVRAFRNDYPEWGITRGIRRTLSEIYEGAVERWT